MEFTLISFSNALLFITFILFLLIVKKCKNTKQNRLPPGPKGLPIIGNLLTIGDRPHESLTHLAKSYGPLLTVHLGRVTTIVASSTEMAREILHKNDQACLGRPIPHAVTAEANYDSSMAWLHGGTQWRKLRKICATQLFTTQRLDALQDLRYQMMQNMIEIVKESRKHEEPIDIGRLVFGTTLNSLSKSMFSVDMMDIRSKEVKELKELIGRIMEFAGKPNLSDFFPILKPFDPQRIRKKIKVSYDRLHSLIDEIIERRLKRRGSGFPATDDFLEALLDQTDELNRTDVRLLLMDLFIGGTDTTTTTLEWAMAELLRNPEILAKAKQELVDIIGSSATGVTERHIPQLVYLDAIIKETMRLHPTAPLLLPHRTEMDVEINGFIIPKHTQIFVNTWSITRDEAYWEEPTKFCPERFLGTDYDFRGKNLTFLPFGAGRRICPGISLGVRMLNLLLATLVHNFDWKLPNGMVAEKMDMKDKFGITLQKAQPLVVIPL